MNIEMSIAAIAVDPMTNMPVVLLKDSEGKFTLPIWIGLLEASAIASELEGIEPPRPMTHDLLISVVKAMKGKIIKVVVIDLADNTYYARVYIEVDGEVLDIDARPSDSMALALRAKAPIFVEEKVISASRTIELKDDMDLNDQEKMKELLENLSPDSFGKYKM